MSSLKIQGGCGFPVINSMQCVQSKDGHDDLCAPIFEKTQTAHAQ